MKIIRIIILEMLLFMAMCFIGTILMKFYDIIFKLNFESIASIGFKVGFFAWIMLLIPAILKNVKTNN